MDLSRMSDVEESDGTAITASTTASTAIRSPLSKTRSLSDGGGGTPKLSPSPFIVEASRRQSKDDIAIRDKESNNNSPSLELPSTPIRTGFHLRGLSLQMPPRDYSASTATAVAAAAQQQHQQPVTGTGSGYVKQQAPLSPKLDHSHMYASPTNILPRRSRGLDFSRAATSLHHSTLAVQASPDSSPTIGSRAMNIPGRRNGDYGTAEQTTSSLWGMMGNQERMHISSSVGSTNHVLSDTSSGSDEDDFMDEDMDEAYVTTPHASKTSSQMSSMGTAPWMPGSPAVNNLLSFQQRRRQRKQPKKKMRGPLGLGFHSPAASGAISKSPPSNLLGARDLPHTRRESISWAANQLHISGNESDGQLEGIDSPSRPSIVRRAVTRRGNLLPKTKGFARIRAALAEEGAPLETEFRREAEVVRQVRESDMDLEPRLPPAAHSAATTALSSPNLESQAQPDDMMLTDDAMMIEPPAVNNPLGLSPATFKQQALRNSKGKVFWDTFSESGSVGRVTPPPPPFGPRASSSGLSLDDMNMDSPSASSGGGNGGGTNQQNPFVVTAQTTTSSSGNGTPQPNGPGTIPSAAEITRRINSKRRHEDDFDPISIKRRAVSPGMSAHNSPVTQSPLQRDNGPWGMTGNSRPGSVGGDSSTVARAGSGGPSENGSGSAGTPGGPGNGICERVIATARGAHHKGGRVGYQGMVDTNDGITRLSIE